MVRSPRINEVVVFRKRREPSFGVVREPVGEKFSVFSEEGKEVEVTSDKVVLPTGMNLGDEFTQSEKKLRLRGLRKELDEKREGVDLKTLWECVFDGGQELTLEELSELYFGTDGDMSEDILLLFWAVEKDDLYFVRGEEGYIPRAPQEVEEAMLRKDAESRKALERKAALEWAKGINENEEQPSGRETNFTNYIELLKGYVIHLDKFERASEARSFMSEAGIKGVEGAIRFLMKTGNWKEDEDPLMKRLGVKEDFPKKVSEEAREVIQKPTFKGTEEDLTELEAYSVDDETTQDIDDAISISETAEGILVGVHIANVAGLVPRWSLLDEEAARRAQTLYLPEGHVHMFPPKLIREKFSLFEGVPKPALSLLVVFDERLNVKSYRFTESKVLVRKNISYNEAEGFLRKSPQGMKLIEIAFGLRKKRIDAGAFIVELPDLKVNVNEYGEIQVKKIYMNTISHIVVSEFMILMNLLAGRFLRENRIPGIFRSQRESVPEEARYLNEDDPLFPLKVVKFLRPSRVELYAEPHSSLGLDVYVQVTSPIRRYLDLVIQRQIIGGLQDGEAPYTEEELEKLKSQVEIGISEKRVVQRTREKYWLLKYLKDFEGQRIRGIVSSVRESGASVYLPEYMLEIPISLTSQMVFKEGNEVDVTVEQVDPLKRRIVVVPS
ncbi:MAG TPA: RNB domain-containing ribonuclease [Thermodesulfobacteriota bacterium]|nr:RNB domain-containing ribonuclease [Thermodesulfobacteriota bacterium]